MPQYLFYNDEWVPERQPIIAAGNRGFRYGDGLFETLFVADGAIRLARFHFERLFAGLELLQLRLPAHYTPAWLADRIYTLCEKNGHAAARVRLTVFRANGNLFDPPDAPAGCLLESQPLPAGSQLTAHSSSLAANSLPLVAGIFPHARKAADAFSHLKSNNYQASAMGALYSREQGLDDVLLLNGAGRVCESTIANVFLLHPGRVITPSLAEGCVAGVMRRFVLGELPALGYAVEEAPVTVDDLHAADEVFLTNALRGLRSVGRCDGREYGCQQTAALAQALEKKWQQSTQLSR